MSGRPIRLPCPNCKGTSSFVSDCRHRRDGAFRRRRECSGCGFRYTTLEVVDPATVKPGGKIPTRGGHVWFGGSPS